MPAKAGLQTFRRLAADKQQRITQTAVDEFCEKGYHGASINAMVERLGIAKGSIFQYFGDKKGLFSFIFERCLEMVKEELRAVRDESRDADIRLRLQR